MTRVWVRGGRSYSLINETIKRSYRLSSERRLQALRLQIAAVYVAFSQAYRFTPQLEHPASAAERFRTSILQEIIISELGLHHRPEYGSVRTKINVL